MGMLVSGQGRLRETMTTKVDTLAAIVHDLQELKSAATETRRDIDKLAIAVEVHARDTARSVAASEDLGVLVGKLSVKYDTAAEQRAGMIADLRAVHSMMSRMLKENGS
jgi:hypothetical protein